jgi:hypothetical protein
MTTTMQTMLKVATDTDAYVKEISNFKFRTWNSVNCNMKEHGIQYPLVEKKIIKKRVEGYTFF